MEFVLFCLLWEKLVAGPRWVPDAKIDWRTDRRSQHNLKLYPRTETDAGSETLCFLVFRIPGSGHSYTPSTERTLQNLLSICLVCASQLVARLQFCLQLQFSVRLQLMFTVRSWQTRDCQPMLFQGGQRRELP
jgi:hypothetical protein